MTRSRIPALLALAVVALTAIAVVARFPTTLHGLSAEARKNNAYTAQGRMLASADSIDIDNSFVIAALDTVPAGATYAVIPPPSQAITDGLIPQITYGALPLYMRYVLLPRRPVSPRTADYILCYGCDQPAARVRWLWVGADTTKIPGLKIGRRLASR